MLSFSRKKNIRKDILEVIEKSSEDQVVLENMNIQDADLKAILLKIQEIRPNIESLYLNQNQLGPKSGKLLSKHGMSFTKLQDINLIGNKLGKEGIRAAFTLLEKNPRIRFSLHGNGVETEEIEQLKDEIRQKVNKSLKKI
ncbi:MAG: hypothetical protein JSR17_02475 [Proteobacteria bacterium]|nr:hypothetical protein [Pseudomonadota bacterium]